MDSDCVFCAIVTGSVAAQRLFESADVVAFADQNPQAPVHVLVIPKTHLRDLAALAADRQAGPAMLSGIKDTAAALGLTSYRTVVNTGAEAGQSVFHVHAHLLAGRAFSWPPG
jgi:histidine triad (HIT) family protein